MDILDLNPGDRVTISGDAWPGEHLITRTDTELEVVYVGEGVDDPIPAHQVTAKLSTRQTRLVTALRESFTESELHAIEVAVDGEYRDVPYQQRLRSAAREARNAA